MGSPTAYMQARATIQRKMRPLILERDGYRCIACGSEDKLEVCHLFPLAKRLAKGDPYGNWQWLNSERNLVTLCERCHAIIDDRFGKLMDDPMVKQLVRAYGKMTEGIRRLLKRKFEDERDTILKAVCQHLQLSYSKVKWYQGARYKK